MVVILCKDSSSLAVCFNIFCGSHREATFTIETYATLLKGSCHLLYYFFIKQQRQL